MVICMKKYLLIIFIFLCILIIDKKTTPEDILVFNYNKDEYYDTYEITFNDISLSKYKEIFINLDMDSYLIKKISFSNNYNNYILNDVNNISIKSGNYKDTMEEYIEKICVVLGKYDLEDEISKIVTGNFKIDKIYIYTTSNIYEEIKKESTKTF